MDRAQTISDHYVVADVGHVGCVDDEQAALYFVEHVGMVTVPRFSFFSDAALVRRLLRFVFTKKLETLEAAGEWLQAFAAERVKR